MALGERDVLERSATGQNHHHHHYHRQKTNSVGVMGSRRIFAPSFKLKVLDSYRNDIDCRGNQRATARKYGIHRRQIQKWLQCEENLRNCCAEGSGSPPAPSYPQSQQQPTPPQQIHFDRLRGAAVVIEEQQPPVSQIPTFPPPPTGPSLAIAAYHQPRLSQISTTTTTTTTTTFVPLPVFSNPSSSSSASDSDKESLACSSSSDSEMDCHSHHLQGGRRRSFSLRFKLDVLDAFHRDQAVAGNQRATARKYGINRRQVQKWLGQEEELRGVIELCGPSSDNRQRLGPIQEQQQHPQIPPIDLKTSSNGCCDLTCCLPPLQRKRPACMLTCCMGATQSGPPAAKKPAPEQETPLCLVKRPSVIAPSSNRDAILFKPYLDNPIIRPADDGRARIASSPLGSGTISQQHFTELSPVQFPRQDVSLELNFSSSWKCGSPVAEFPGLKSAFVRYTANARYA